MSSAATRTSRAVSQGGMCLLHTGSSLLCQVMRNSLAWTNLATVAIYLLLVDGVSINVSLIWWLRILLNFSIYFMTFYWITQWTIDRKMLKFKSLNVGVSLYLSVFEFDSCIFQVCCLVKTHLRLLFLSLWCCELSPGPSQVGKCTAAELCQCFKILKQSYFSCPGWTWICDLLVSASQLIELQTCATTSFRIAVFLMKLSLKV